LPVISIHVPEPKVSATGAMHAAAKNLANSTEALPGIQPE